MRKIIIILFVLTLSFNVPRANAIIVFDPTAQGTRIVQLAKEIITAGADVATKINTWTLALKVSVLDPLGNAMIAVSLLKQQTNTINLVTGSLGGNPLLISNPEQWIKNQGLNTVRISLGDISSQNGLYSDSVFGSVVNNFRASNRSLQVSLQNINTSSVPKIVQNNICNDTSLTQTAKNDVMRSDGTFDQGDLTRRKQEIWNSLCAGNPATDMQLAQKLAKVNTQRPDIGGWDAWLAVTGGDNPYNKSVQANLAISKQVEEKKGAARDDLNRGGGVASPANCKTSDRAEVDQNGEPVLTLSDALCRVTTLSNTGSAVNSAFQASINAPMQRLVSSFGSGIIGTLSTLLAARNTIGMLSNAFSGISMTLGGDGGGTNTAIGISSSSTPAQDLLNNPEGRRLVSDPTTRRLDMYSDSLSKLEETNSAIRVEISMAKRTAEEINSCYGKLVDEFNLTSDYPGIKEAALYYASRIPSLNRLLSRVDQSSTVLTDAQRGVTETRTKIEQSNSSEEISNLYNAFEEKVNNGTYPSDSLATEREGEYQNLKGENEADGLEGSTAYKLRAQCMNLRAALTPREAAGS